MYIFSIKAPPPLENQLSSVDLPVFLFGDVFIQRRPEAFIVDPVDEQPAYPVQVHNRDNTFGRYFGIIVLIVGHKRQRQQVLLRRAIAVERFQDQDIRYRIAGRKVKNGSDAETGLVPGLAGKPPARIHVWRQHMLFQILPERRNFPQFRPGS